MQASMVPLRMVPMRVRAPAAPNRPAVARAVPAAGSVRMLAVRRPLAAAARGAAQRLRAAEDDASGYVSAEDEDVASGKVKAVSKMSVPELKAEVRRAARSGTGRSPGARPRPSSRLTARGAAPRGGTSRRRGVLARMQARCRNRLALYCCAPCRAPRRSLRSAGWTPRAPSLS